MLKLRIANKFKSRRKQSMALGLMCCAVTASCQTSALLVDSDLKSQAANQPVAKECKPFKHDDGFMSVKASFDGTGKFCLTEDLSQRLLYEVGEGRKTGSPKRGGVVSAFGKAHDLDIDLQGHLVTGAPFDDTTGIRATGESRIRFHNGIVKTPGSKGLGVEMATHKNSYQSSDWISREDKPAVKLAEISSPTGSRVEYAPWNYFPPTNYTAENLKIESGGRGAIMSGTRQCIAQ